MTTPQRCAIYTRKSSEEGLEQEFNSLHAQREACEAYIKSQKHEGWELVKTAYDDGGISGGTMERPALQSLLADIKANKVDIIVVYKVDRLTRSLADFAKMVELFDAHKVSFVSVTQQFNTTSSMGRLTLNVLLSFAQFEREVTGERIRDKIAASKKKGMFMGGVVSIGYEVHDRKLVINPHEAEKVRLIYRRYLDLGCVRLLHEELIRRNIRSKGERCIMSRGALRNMLTNPIYVGRIRHRDACYEGQHKPIIDLDVWNKVQQFLKGNSVKPKKPPRITSPSLLVGKLFDDSGRRMSPTHGAKNGVRYRYYISRGLMTGTREQYPDGWRVPAQELEQTVIRAIRGVLNDRSAIATTLQEAGVPASHVSATLKNLVEVGKQLESEAGAAIIPTLVERVVLKRDGIQLTLVLTPYIPKGGSVPITITRDIPMQIRRRGVEMRLVINGDNAATKPDPSLIKAIARAHVWFEELSSGKTRSISAIAKRERIDKGYVSHLINLAFLAPDIIEAIVASQQPADFTVHKLIKGMLLPLKWKEQRSAIFLN